LHAVFPLPCDSQRLTAAIQRLAQIEGRPSHEQDCITETLLVPVVFLVLPISVVFALYPGFLALNLSTP
jgi:hypothetical protein